jgi:hypothetical protein
VERPCSRLFQFVIVSKYRRIDDAPHDIHYIPLLLMLIILEAADDAVINYVLPVLSQSFTGISQPNYSLAFLRSRELTGAI